MRGVVSWRTLTVSSYIFIWGVGTTFADPPNSDSKHQLTTPLSDGPRQAPGTSAQQVAPFAQWNLTVPEGHFAVGGSFAGSPTANIGASVAYGVSPQLSVEFGSGWSAYPNVFANDPRLAVTWSVFREKPVEIALQFGLDVPIRFDDADAWSTSSGVSIKINSATVRWDNSLGINTGYRYGEQALNFALWARSTPYLQLHDQLAVGVPMTALRQDENITLDSGIVFNFGIWDTAGSPAGWLVQLRAQSHGLLQFGGDANTSRTHWSISSRVLVAIDMR